MSSSGKGHTSIPSHVKFMFGGLSGMAATCFVQPLDLIKNRMQVSGGRLGLVEAIQNVIKADGFTGLYNGLSAGLLRQATYTTTRLGIYNTLFEKVCGDGSTSPSFLVKAGIGMTAGGIAAVIGTPAEISLIRMSADGSLPAAERRNYSSVFNALSRIAKEEGVLTLWKGCGPTVMRAMVVNAAQLATYSQAKENFKSTFSLEDGVFLHFCSSMVSGLATTIASMPVDIVKTRIQNMRVINGVPEYNGVAHVVRTVVQKEGFFALWKGFLPYYSRIGPHTVLTFIFLEQLRRLYNNKFD